jgi:hypothetical protein
LILEKEMVIKSKTNENDRFKNKIIILENKNKNSEELISEN